MGGYVLRATFSGPTCCGVPGDGRIRKGPYPERSRSIGYTHRHGPDHLLYVHSSLQLEVANDATYRGYRINDGADNVIPRIKQVCVKIIRSCEPLYLCKYHQSSGLRLKSLEAKYHLQSGLGK